MIENLKNITDQLEHCVIPLSISKHEIEYAVEVLFEKILFPTKDDTADVLQNSSKVFLLLQKNFCSIIEKSVCEERLILFFQQLPAIRQQLLSEVNFYVENDPATDNREEVILAYPGFFALAVHRMAHRLYELKIPVIPRLFSEYAHSKVGIDIHPGATIGRNLFIDHGTGIVIGETTEIGNNVTIYQGVTLGALFVNKGLRQQKRHPTIEDNVIIYAGATILGGNTVIGKDSVIGGNVWLIKSVPPYSQVYHEEQVNIKNKNV